MEKAITNIITGVTEYIEMTSEEIAKYNEYKKQADEEIAANLVKRSELEAKRAATLAKLEALGLDEDDLKALGL